MNPIPMGGRWNRRFTADPDNCAAESRVSMNGTNSLFTCLV